MCFEFFKFVLFFIQLVIADDYQGQDAYIGCYIDSRLARDLNKLPGQIGNVWIGSNSNMTIAACLDLCRGFSLPYAGLEFGNECYCGDTYGRYGQASDSECNYYCHGNPNELCGGLSRLSVYSVRILVRSELIAVANVTELNFSPIRVAQASSFIDPSKLSWIEYSKESGEFRIYIYLKQTLSSPTVITLNSIRPDLPRNRGYAFLSLRGNQIAAFYNCQITDAKLVNDPSDVEALTRTFFSTSAQPVNGQLMFNQNLNRVFRAYGCVNLREDAYGQMVTHSGSLLYDYCQLALGDLQRVNFQISNLLDSVKIDEKISRSNLAIIESNLNSCSKKCFKNIN